MSLKLDISKLYDRVEWEFLIEMMSALGSAQNWIDLIMKCVSTVSFSILVNGSPKGPICPTRGLRQGGSSIPLPVPPMY